MSNKRTITVNGTGYEIPAEWQGRRLLDYLRIELNLVGSKEGCGEGDCGACTVLVDGEPQCSCLLLCGVSIGQSITTIEGLPEEHLGRFAEACDVKGGVQCGFCTPGMAVMSYWLTNRRHRDRCGVHRTTARGQHLPLHRLQPATRHI